MVKITLPNLRKIKFCIAKNVTDAVLYKIKLLTSVSCTYYNIKRGLYTTNCTKFNTLFPSFFC